MPPRIGWLKAPHKWHIFSFLLYGSEYQIQQIHLHNVATSLSAHKLRWADEWDSCAAGRAECSARGLKENQAPFQRPAGHCPIAAAFGVHPPLVISTEHPQSITIEQNETSYSSFEGKKHPREAHAEAKYCKLRNKVNPPSNSWEPFPASKGEESIAQPQGCSTGRSTSIWTLPSGCSDDPTCSAGLLLPKKPLQGVTLGGWVLWQAAHF